MLRSLKKVISVLLFIFAGSLFLRGALIVFGLCFSLIIQPSTIHSAITGSQQALLRNDKVASLWQQDGESMGTSISVSVHRFLQDFVQLTR